MGKVSGKRRTECSKLTDHARATFRQIAGWTVAFIIQSDQRLSDVPRVPRKPIVPSPGTRTGYAQTKMDRASIFYDIHGLSLLRRVLIANELRNRRHKRGSVGDLIMQNGNPAGMDVVRRAYELWEQVGRPEGKDQEFYHFAEQELRNAADKSSPLRAPDNL